MSNLVCTECGEEASEFTKSDVDLFCQTCCPEHDYQRNDMDRHVYCIHCGLEVDATYFDVEPDFG